MSKNGFRLDASDREKRALRTAPAFLQNFCVSRSGGHSAFKELFWTLWGGTARFGSSFFAALGRQSVFWEPTSAFKRAPRALQKSKISRHQKGGDFSTKKCSFYRGQRQILTLGFFWPSKWKGLGFGGSKPAIFGAFWGSNLCQRQF